MKYLLPLLVAVAYSSQANCEPAFYIWDVPPTATFEDRGSTPGECPVDGFGEHCSVAFTFRSARISGGLYGVDYDGDGARDGQLTTDVEVVSNFYRNDDGSYHYAWRITNYGTGAVSNFIGANTPQFVISSASPLLGLAGADRKPGTADDFGSPRSLTVSMDSQIGPHSEAFGIIPNPSSGMIGSLWAPTSDQGSPLVHLISLLPNPALLGTTRTLVAGADDLDSGNSPIAELSYRIDSGPWIPMAALDGSYDEPMETATAALQSPAGSRIQQVCVRAADERNNSSEPECALSAIYADSASLVTGGGAFEFEPSSCLVCSGDDEEANFGFVARTTSRDPTPSGQLELTIAKDLKFHSGTFEWLMVSGGEALLRGTGTVNGEGQYAFTLHVLDSAAGDLVRLRIWRPSDNRLIFDNERKTVDFAGPVTPLAQGSIIVHAKK
jgi:hypothetical protein